MIKKYPVLKPKPEPFIRDYHSYSVYDGDSLQSILDALKDVNAVLSNVSIEVIHDYPAEVAFIWYVEKQNPKYKEQLRKWQQHKKQFDKKLKEYKAQEKERKSLQKVKEIEGLEQSIDSLKKKLEKVRNGK